MRIGFLALRCEGSEAEPDGNLIKPVSLLGLRRCLDCRPALLLGLSDGLSTCRAEFRALSDR